MALDLSGSIARGADAAEQRVEDHRPAGSVYEKINWFKLDDGESMLIRFIDDASEWLTVAQHLHTKTKPAPEGYSADKKWNDVFSAVCRRDDNLAHLFPDGCYICDEMHNVRPNPKTAKKGGKWYPAIRSWARAVVREEVRAQDEQDAKELGVEVGEVGGYQDVMVEVDEIGEDGKPTGNKVEKPLIIVINNAWKNFFGPLKGYADAWPKNGHSLLDRDFLITRKGTGTETTYSIVPMDKIIRDDKTVLDLRTTPEEIWDEKTQTLVATGRSRKEALLAEAPDLLKLIEERINDEFYHKFFDDRVKYVFESKKDDDEDDARPAKKDTPAVDPEVEEADRKVVKDRLANMRAQALRERVSSDHGKPAGEDEEPEVPEGDKEPVAAGSGRRRRLN
jgi:hypothetical protein